MTRSDEMYKLVPNKISQEFYAIIRFHCVDKKRSTFTCSIQNAKNSTKKPKRRWFLYGTEICLFTSIASEVVDKDCPQPATNYFFFLATSETILGSRITLLTLATVFFFFSNFTDFFFSNFKKVSTEVSRNLLFF